MMLEELPLLFLCRILKILRLTQSDWKFFSTKFVRSTFYKYHDFKLGIKTHNFIVDKVLILDSFLKILQVSYILILKKK